MAAWPRAALAGSAAQALLRALLLRLAVYRARLLLSDGPQEDAAAALKATLDASDQGVNLALFILFALSVLSQSVRRRFAGLLLPLLAILSGLSAASPSGLLSGSNTRITFSHLEQFGAADIRIGNLNSADLMTMTLDTQPTMLVALPVGALVASMLWWLPGAFFLAVLAAGASPYLQARITAAWYGWGEVSFAASVGSGVSGLFSLFAMAWLLVLIWRMAGGRTIFGNRVALAQSSRTTGSPDPGDASFIAATAIVQLLSMPLWVGIALLRYWLWVMSCGLLFNSHLKSD